MTLEQCRAAARATDARFIPAWAEAVRDPDGRTLEHLRWMVVQIHAADMTEDKAMRFLGYIQGQLVAVTRATLGQITEINRAAQTDGVA